MEANIFQTLEQETNVSIWFKAPNSKFWIKERTHPLYMAAKLYDLNSFDDSHFLHGRVYKIFPEKYDPNVINYNFQQMYKKL